MVYNEANKKNWTKDGRHWYFRVSYRDIRGKKRYYKSKKYKTKTEAENAELEYKSKRDNSIKVKFDIVANACFEYMKKTMKESTTHNYSYAYNSRLKPYFENYYIQDISINVIESWKNEMLKLNFKPNYLNKLFNLLSIILNYGVKYYGLNRNNAKICGRFNSVNDQVIADENKLRYITYDEFKKFISVIDNNMWKTFFIVLFYTGMRKSEVIALTWKEIDFISDEILVNKILSYETNLNYKITNTKTATNRKVKMSKTLKMALLSYKEEISKYTDFNENWFVFGNTLPLARTTIDRNKDKYFELSGVRRITIHEFRHSHVSLLINEYIKTSKEKNMKVDTAKFFLMMSNRMGHSIEVMQETYMHLFPTIQDEVVDLLDNL